MQRFLQFISREIGGLHEAAYVLAFFAILSQLLAFLRDRLLAHTYGAGPELDAYFAAFRVPDLIYITAASLVSLAVLIPFLARAREVGKGEERAFLDSIFSVFFFGIVAVSAVGFVFAPALTHLFFPGFSYEVQETATVLMRIMLLQPILLGVSNFFASITQLDRRFLLYAISPLLYNVGIIGGIVFLVPVFGLPALAWGVVAGALLHLLPQVVALARSRSFPRIRFSFPLARVGEVAYISLPRALTLSLQQLTMLALTAFATLAGAGSVAVFSFAWNIQSVPLSIVGVSYSFAAFPALAGLWARGARDIFLETLLSAARHIIFWSLPALTLFIVLRAQIVRTILGSGAFDWADTRLTAACLALFALSVVAQGLLLLLTRAYYAAGRTREPLCVAVSGALITVVCSFLFLKLFTFSPASLSFFEMLLRVEGLPGTDVLALPLAFSLGSLGSALALWIFFRRDFGAPPLFSRSFFQGLCASIVGGAVAYTLLNVFDDYLNLQTTLGVFAHGLFAGMGGLLAWALTLRLLSNREIKEILGI